ncbi:PDCD2 family protein [Megaselia abdita]
MNVDLGFVEECSSGLLTNKYFPSKIGGKPAWLELKSLPKFKQLQCESCKEPKTFLCQVYAPDEDNPECFHRTVYVFVCRNPDCNIPNSSQNFAVFRSQLEVTNNFFSEDPPDEDTESPAIPSPVTLCLICGCRGPMSCARCKKASYCCQSHQKADWKNHKVNCNAESTSNTSETPQTVLFPEFELVIEPEPSELEKDQQETEEEANSRRLEEFKKLQEEGKTGDLKDLPETELSQYAQSAEDVEDKTFKKFKKRIQRSPEQVLRYERNGKPLWITENTEEIKIPYCDNCGFERTFEFQIMPQLLNHLKDDKLDWGVLAVYTCKNDCSVLEGGYSIDYLIKQDISS